MCNAASGWLMTSLNPNPLMVSLAQVATTLPMFLFALPAGALADIFDRRRLLMMAEIGITAVSTIFAIIVWLDAVTPASSWVIRDAAEKIHRRSMAAVREGQVA
jgi:MFS family permease